MFRKLHEPDSAWVEMEIDGLSVIAEPGESVAAVLLRQAEPWSHVSSVSQAKRAPYCMMGVCFECVAEIDGIGSIQTCMTQVRAGMKVIRQTTKRKLES